jgi:signal transduction histidine kinase
LLGNAIKFTDAGGQVRLTYGRATDGGGVTIAVRDTGVGIADADVKYIFDEFFQLRNPERDRNKGNGLGLTICKRLTDAMGGRLTVDSAPGRGSTFTIVLPASVVVPAPQV